MKSTWLVLLAGILFWPMVARAAVPVCNRWGVCPSVSKYEVLPRGEAYTRAREMERCGEMNECAVDNAKLNYEKSFLPFTGIVLKEKSTQYIEKQEAALFKKADSCARFTLLKFFKCLDFKYNSYVKWEMSGTTVNQKLVDKVNSVWPDDTYVVEEVGDEGKIKIQKSKFKIENKNSFIFIKPLGVKVSSYLKKEKNGQVAYGLIKKLVLHKRIKLMEDPRADFGGITGQYYIFLEDGRSFNVELLKKGYGQVEHLLDSQGKPWRYLFEQDYTPLGGSTSKW